MQSTSFNIARYLPLMAKEMPDRPAVVTQRDGASLTFAELEAGSNRYANGLAGIGITHGVRTLVLIKPGLDFIAVVFALLKVGALPCMIDAGVGLANLLDCIRQVRPGAMIGISRAHMLRLLRPAAFRSITRVVTVGRRLLWGGPTLRQLHDRSSEKFTMTNALPDDKAAILFTSGSTGPAKGVVYEHGMFDAQIRSLRQRYGFERGEIELATFPLFALFCPALGMTCVLPDMDFSHPGQVNPTRIVDAVRRFRPTTAFGSPALWNKVSAHCRQSNTTLSGLRRVLIAGAPVDWRLVEKLSGCLNSSTRIYTPYGATEALPVSSISDEAILGDCLAKTRSGAGICVGMPIRPGSVRIIKIDDEPIEAWSDDLELPEGKIGEIVVSGEIVSEQYFELPNATAGAKIRDGEVVWHRIGDVGYFDERGALWYGGRKAQRVETAAGPLFPVCCEGVFNQHGQVARSALVGIGPRGCQKAVIVIELAADAPSDASKRQAISEELLELAAGCAVTACIRTVLFRRSFPVDVRHNAKINREALAAWAARQLQ